MPGREQFATFTDIMFVPVVESFDEIVRPRLPCGIEHVEVVGFEPPVSDVLHDGAREQVGDLLHDAELCLPPLERAFPEVDAVDQNLALVRFVEPCGEVDDRGLATSGGADQSDRFTLANGEIEVLENRFLRFVMEPDATELDRFDDLIATIRWAFRVGMRFQPCQHVG